MRCRNLRCNGKLELEGWNVSAIRSAHPTSVAMIERLDTVLLLKSHALQINEIVLVKVWRRLILVKTRVLVLGLHHLAKVREAAEG